MHSPATLPFHDPQRPSPPRGFCIVRTLVTGASGFVGRALVRHLAANGDEVAALSRSTGGPELTDRQAVYRAITSQELDVVYHLGAQSHVPTAWSDPIGTLRINAEGTQNVLDAAADAPGSPRVLVVTSAEVYGSVAPEELPIGEHAPLRPNNPYAASKVAADAISQQAFLGRGQDVVRLRAFNHIGPGQSPNFVCAGLAHRIADAEAAGATHIEVGNLDVRRDFSDVRDVVAAYRMVAAHGTSGGVYNVCSGQDRSIGELARGLVELSGTSLELVTNPEFVRPVDTPVVRGDNTRLRSDTGWQPLIDIWTTLADVLNEARQAQQ